MMIKGAHSNLRVHLHEGENRDETGMNSAWILSEMVHRSVRHGDCLSVRIPDRLRSTI